jgi:hypothetical protein
MHLDPVHPVEPFFPVVSLHAFHQSFVTELIYTPERTNLNDKFNYFSCRPRHPKARAASMMAGTSTIWMTMPGSPVATPPAI